MNERLQRHLDGAGVPYEILPHKETFTAQEIAASTHVSGRHLAKVLIVKGDSGRFYMAVIPASSRLDGGELAHVAGEPVALAGEREFEPLFPDCEVGAMPPFGNLYGIPVFVERAFATTPDIVFQAGNHHEAVRMRYADYARLEQPVAGDISIPWITAPEPGTWAP